MGPWNFGRVGSAPPTIRVGTSGPGRVGDEKSGQNRKPDAFLKSQRKIKKLTFFSIFLVPIFSDPKFGRVVGGGPPKGGPGHGGSARRTVKFHFSVDFESYGAVHTTFITKTMV